MCDFKEPGGRYCNAAEAFVVDDRTICRRPNMTKRTAGRVSPTAGELAGPTLPTHCSCGVSGRSFPGRVKGLLWRFPYQGYDDRVSSFGDGPELVAVCDFEFTLGTGYRDPANLADDDLQHTGLGRLYEATFSGVFVFLITYQMASAGLVLLHHQSAADSMSMALGSFRLPRAVPGRQSQLCARGEAECTINLSRRATCRRLHQQTVPTLCLLVHHFKRFLVRGCAAVGYFGL